MAGEIFRIFFNNQRDVDIAISSLNLNTPVFIATGALSSTPGMSLLISEHDIRSSQVADSHFTPAQNKLFNIRWTAHLFLSLIQWPTEISVEAASTVLIQNFMMLNPQNILLLEELSLDKLKKFEHSVITRPYTSDMLLCQKHDSG